MRFGQKVRKVIEAHIKAGGLVTAPNSLVDDLVKAVGPKRDGKEGRTILLALTGDEAGELRRAVADAAAAAVDGHTERTMSNIYHRLLKLTEE